MQLRYLANRTASCAPAATQLPSPAANSAIPVPAIEPAGPDPRVILCSIGELVYDWDFITDKLNWGPNLAEVLGPVASADLSTGLAYGDRLSPESASSRYDAIVNSQKKDEGSGVPYQAVYALSPPRETGGGPAIWIEDCGRWFAGPDKRPAKAHGVVRVITERHELERQLARRSQFDTLTGAMNRALLAEYVQRLLAQNERSHKPFAIMLVALENLFALNRTYGYDAGDEVVAGLATRLRANLRVNDLIARHAGNKFALLLEGCDAQQSKAAAQRLLDAVASAPFDTSAGSIPATVRIGGVIAPREGRTAAVLFQHAEEALDYARQRTGARFAAYTSSLARKDGRLRALQIADNVVSALNESRVELAFQPIVSAATGETAFYEALLRVRHANGSLVPPGDILPVAEKAGLVRLLDQRVLELALARLAKDKTLHVSVNASNATIQDSEWPDWLANAVAPHPGVADRLIIEITETTMIDDFETTRHFISACKRLGIKVAMDDFGAGHTSFRNLRQLNFDFVKIDGVFVQNVVKSEDDRFFVRTLIDLAKHLELKIVAEWVEDEETARILREWGVDYFQGSHFGAAQPAPA